MKSRRTQGAKIAKSVFQRAAGAVVAAGRVGSFMLCHRKSRKVAACSIRLSRWKCRSGGGPRAVRSG